MYELQLQMELAKHYHIPYFSYSQLNSYQGCPKSYFFSYVDPERERSAGNKYTKLGNVLHEVFEHQGKNLIIESEPLTQGQALKQFNTNYMKIPHADFTDKEDWLKMYEKGVQAVENYYSVYADRKPLFVEKEFKLKMAEGLPECKAYIDRIDGDPENPQNVSEWILSDYKTGSSPKSKDYLREDIQMGIYVALVYARYGQYPKAVQFVHPVPNKVQQAIHVGDGVYEFTGQRAPVVTFSVAETITKVRQIIADIVTDVKNDSFKKVPEPWSCKGCWHFDKCKPFLKNTGWESVGNG